MPFLTTSTSPAHFPPEIKFPRPAFSFPATFNRPTATVRDDGSGVTSIQTVHPRDRSLKAKHS